MADRFFRIGLDGRWLSSEMADLFGSLEAAYIAIAQVTDQSLHRELQRVELPLTKTSNIGVPDDALIVREISYSSPGFSDLGGAGKIIEQLVNLVFGLYDRIASREDRALARQRQRLEIEAMSIENYGAWLRKVQETNETIESLPDIQLQLMRDALIKNSVSLGQMMARGRITSVELLSPPDE